MKTTFLNTTKNFRTKLFYNQHKRLRLMTCLDTNLADILFSTKFKCHYNYNILKINVAKWTQCVLNLHKCHNFIFLNNKWNKNKTREYKKYTSFKAFRKFISTHMLVEISKQNNLIIVLSTSYWVCLNIILFFVWLVLTIKKNT